MYFYIVPQNYKKLEHDGNESNNVIDFKVINLINFITLQRARDSDKNNCIFMKTFLVLRELKHFLTALSTEALTLRLMLPVSPFTMAVLS